MARMDAVLTYATPLGSIFSATAQDAGEACETRKSDVCSAAWHLTHNANVSHGLDLASLPLTIAGILIVAWLAHRIIRRSIRRAVLGLQDETLQRRLGKLKQRAPRVLQRTDQNASLRRVQRAETIGALLRSASTVGICVVTVLAILSQFELSLAPIIAGAGVATAGLAFGAQNVVRDFLAGLFIVVEDQYGVGDVIDVDKTSGLVESVGLRITRIRSADGTLWHVPNGEIKRVGNMSQTWSRALLEFRVDLGTDIDVAIGVIKSEADALWRESQADGTILEEPEVWGPEEMNAQGILIKLAVKTQPLEQWQISRTLRSRVKAALDAAGIEIAAPTRYNVAGITPPEGS